MSCGLSMSKSSQLYLDMNRLKFWWISWSEDKSLTKELKQNNALNLWLNIVHWDACFDRGSVYALFVRFWSGFQAIAQIPDPCVWYWNDLFIHMSKILKKCPKTETKESFTRMNPDGGCPVFECPLYLA